VTLPNSSEAPAVASRSATIIPFPARVKPGPVVATPEDRLARALASLNAALAEQKSAVAAWRDVLGELKTTTAGLDESLQRYRSNLRSLGTSVSALHAKARSLEQWADGVAAVVE
jgi:ABC-type transporter Mla subunit MlaD